MKRFITSVAISVLAVIAGCRAPQGGSGEANVIPGVVAADHPLASAAGASVLRAGGNAVDAAVAASFALSVVRPYSCGIGGGGFMVIHLPFDPEHGEVTTAINYRERSPRRVGPDSYERWAAQGDVRASRDGGRAVGVPGTVAGLLHAHERYGRIPLDEIMAPAIALAERGFVVDAHHAAASAAVLDRFRRDGLIDRFDWLADRLEIGEGEIWINREQARALRLIAARGRGMFYGEDEPGPIGRAVLDAVGADGGVMTPDDVTGYTVREVEPIRAAFGEDELLLMPPPSSGGLALAQWFGVLERLGTEIPVEGWYDTDTAHELAEAMKHAFADRARHLADPDFVDVPVGQLLDDGYLDALAGRVGDAPLDVDAYGSNREKVGIAEDAGTSHISVVDRWGGAVACSETINTRFGSLLAVPEYGFILNNEMDDFTTRRGEVNSYGLRQSDANLPEPGKRPLSSMSPTIVVDGDGAVWAVAGGSGGPRIISATGQVLLRMIQGGAGAPEAVAAPRVHHQWLPDLLRVERGIDESIAQTLALRGHEIRESASGLGVVQAIVRTEGGWSAASDPRKGGKPAWE